MVNGFEFDVSSVPLSNGPIEEPTLAVCLKWSRFLRTTSMPKLTKTAQRLLIALISISILELAVLEVRDLLDRRSSASGNAIMIIAPYYHNGTWVFDDPGVGLRREPFVAGVPEMIDVLVKDIPNAKDGFRLLFSARPFPDYQKKLIWVRNADLGNYYRFDGSAAEGWICPALFKYYKSAPKEIYVKAEPIPK
jgi:hypothetical protein